MWRVILNAAQIEKKRGAKKNRFSVFLKATPIKLQVGLFVSENWSSLFLKKAFDII